MDDLKIPRDKYDDYSQESVSRRLQWLEQRTDKKLPYLKGTPYPPSEVKGTCENYIGTVGIPVGIAGPLLINGVRAKGKFLVPMATMEGALVASYSRGMRVITESGGCDVVTLDNAAGTYRHLSDVISKVSAVILKSAADREKFDQWLRVNTDNIVNAVNSTSRYANLVELAPLYQGDIVGLLFKYNTGEAMGLNMASKANEAACKYILDQCEYVVDYFNTLGGDKRFVNSEGKGKYVSASVCIPERLIQDKLRSTPRRMSRYLSACNSILNQQGSTAMNIHVANALTAMYISCGQDPAFVTASFKNACTTFELSETGDLLASLTLPNVIVGSVGSGSRLPAQKECLVILGCAHDARKLAEVIAAVALAGEISVAGAVTAGEFSLAHTTLGRGVTNTK